MVEDRSVSRPDASTGWLSDPLWNFYLFCQYCNDVDKAQKMLHARKGKEQLGCQ